MAFQNMEPALRITSEEEHVCHATRVMGQTTAKTATYPTPSVNHNRRQLTADVEPPKDVDP